MVSKEELLLEIGKLNSLTPLEYVTKAERVQDMYDQYIDFQKRVCTEEFSNKVFSQKESDENQKDCLRKLRELEIDYTEKSYTARKNYLEYLHAERLKELKRIHDEAISALKKQKD